MMDLKETQEGWVWWFRNGRGTKIFEKQYWSFEPFWPSASKVEFLSIDLLGGLQDNMKKKPRLIIIIIIIIVIKDHNSN